MKPRPNPILEWLARVAAECGSPGEMVRRAHELPPRNRNSRDLIIRYAQLWSSRIDQSRKA